MNNDKPTTIKVALVQHQCTDQPEDNLQKCLAGIDEAAQQGAQLVLLQELHNTKYFCQVEDPRFFEYAETIPGPTTSRLCEKAGELGLVIVCSLFEQRAQGLYHNTAVVIDSDGTIAGQYRKMHIPDDPGYYEKYYFTPGDLGFQTIHTRLGTLGVLVCWDQWYPEAARLMRLAGAEMLLYPTAIGWEVTDSDEEKDRQLQAWQTIQRSHAIANHIPVLSCNRSGSEYSPADQNQRIDFWGSSFVCGPQGEILAQAPYNKECVLVADINLARCHEISRNWPFLRDRRIDFYQEITKRFRDS